MLAARRLRSRYLSRRGSFLSYTFDFELRLLDFEDFLGEVMSDSVVADVEVEVIEERLVMDERDGRAEWIFGAA